MIRHISVRHVALIEQLDIDLEEGLTIFSGETGAGKSILIDAIQFALGGRPDKDFIRGGAEHALVEMIVAVSPDNEPVTAELRELGIELDEENAFLIARTLNQLGKSTCKLNGRTVTVGVLKEAAALIVDIHGQHEHQSILNPLKHIKLLDRFCGEAFAKAQDELAGFVKRHRDIVRAIGELTGDERERQAKLDLLGFQRNEIEMAGLKQGEEEELTERKTLLSAADKLIGASEQALELLYRSEDASATELIAKASACVSDIAAMDAGKAEMADALATLLFGLEDIVAELRHYHDHLEHDPAELDEIEARLDLIYRLKRKYGHSVKEILDYYDTITEQLDRMENSGEQLLKLNRVKEELEKEINVLCGRLTEERIKTAAVLQTQIETTLTELGMPKARFQIAIGQRDEFSATGRDKVEFMISANVGQDIKPLAQVASGGEMSRIMLALKTVLLSADPIETFIFDEIDTGVSGRTAQQVAEKLSLIAKRRQILCITHLPQIAAMADTHVLIEKQSDQANTKTFLYTLDEDKQVTELARLIGGAKITGATIEAAREMKQLAKKVKIFGKEGSA